MRKLFHKSLLILTVLPISLLGTISCSPVTPEPEETIKLNVPVFADNLPYILTATKFKEQVDNIVNLNDKLILLFGNSTNLNKNNVQSLTIEAIGTKIKATILLQKNYVFNINNGENTYSITTPKDFIITEPEEIIKLDLPVFDNNLPYTLTAIKFKEQVDNTANLNDKLFLLFGKSTNLNKDNVQSLTIEVVGAKIKATILLQKNYVFNINNGENTYSITTPKDFAVNNSFEINNGLMINIEKYKDIANALNLAKEENLPALTNQILLDKIKASSVASQVQSITIVSGSTKYQKAFLELKINNDPENLKITEFTTLQVPSFLVSTQQQVILTFEINKNEYFKNLVNQNKIATQLDTNLLFTIAERLQIGEVGFHNVFDKDALLKYKNLITVKDVRVIKDPTAEDPDNWGGDLEFSFEVSFSEYQYTNNAWNADGTLTKTIRKRQSSTVKFFLPKKVEGYQYLLDNLKVSTTIDKKQFSSFVFARAKENTVNTLNFLNFDQTILDTYFSTDKVNIDIWNVDEVSDSAYNNSIVFDDATGTLKIDAFLHDKKTNLILTDLIPKQYVITGFTKIDEYIHGSSNDINQNKVVAGDADKANIIRRLKTYGIDFNAMQANESITKEEVLGTTTYLFFNTRSYPLFRHKENTGTGEWVIPTNNRYFFSILGNTFSSNQQASPFIDQRNSIFKTTTSNGFYVRNLSLNKKQNQTTFRVTRTSDNKIIVRQEFQYNIQQTPSYSAIVSPVILEWTVNVSELI
ncbi:MAG: hypothetical protein ACRC9U_03085 [Metamycoplasmataceae bacterium]